jgi:hypothetical protein
MTITARRTARERLDRLPKAFTIIYSGNRR